MRYTHVKKVHFLGNQDNWIGRLQVHLNSANSVKKTIQKHLQENAESFKELQRGVHARLLQIEAGTVQMSLYSFDLAVMVKILPIEEEKYTLTRLHSHPSKPL